jgi:hypothetical protein
MVYAACRLNRSTTSSIRLRRRSPAPGSRRAFDDLSEASNRIRDRTCLLARELLRDEGRCEERCTLRA